MDYDVAIVQSMDPSRQFPPLISVHKLSDISRSHLSAIDCEPGDYDGGVEKLSN